MDKVLFLVDVINDKNNEKVEEIQKKLIEGEIAQVEEITTEMMRLIKLECIDKLYDQVKISDKIYYITDIDIEKDYDKRTISGLVTYANEIGKDLRYFIIKEEEKEMEDKYVVFISDIGIENQENLINFKMKELGLNKKVYELNTSEKKVFDNEYYEKISNCEEVYVISDKLYDGKIITKEAYDLVRHAEINNKTINLYHISEGKISRWERVEMEDMKTITICGSTKQKSQILELKIMLEAKGYRVFTPEFDVKSPNECVMFSIHKVKMDASDIVYFLLKPRDGLSHEAGTGMQREIQYAIRQEKEIRFVSPEEIRI